MKQSSNLAFLFKYQFQHLLLLVALYFGALHLADLQGTEGTLWGIPTSTWFYLTLINAVLHQVIVAFVFRLQLVYKIFTRLFGKYDLLLWGFVFIPFLILRPVFSVLTALSDVGSLYIPNPLAMVVGILLLIPALAGLYSVFRYFGINRALGADHFRDEYRNKPLVRKGMFKYSSNAMYLYVFLLFWAVALFTGSLRAFSLALFQHAYIWVHMFCTEEPDMQRIYGT